MASWILIPSLVTLRSEFNAIAPGRDKSSDGSVGDTAHQNSQSDHNPDETGNVPIRDADKINEVHAIDVDRDLRAPFSMEDVVQFLLAECRAGRETRLKYIIFNRRIWSASSGWRQNAYTGSNPHDHHAHFSGKYDTASESSTRSYGLEEEFMSLSADDKKWISAEIAKQVKAAVEPLLAGIPTAQENADATFARARNDPKSMLSDTAVNLTEARITKAVKDGVVIAPYPYNEGKL